MNNLNEIKPLEIMLYKQMEVKRKKDAREDFFIEAKRIALSIGIFGAVLGGAYMLSSGKEKVSEYMNHQKKGMAAYEKIPLYKLVQARKDFDRNGLK